MKKYLLLVGLLSICTNLCVAQSSRKLLMQGDFFMGMEDFVQAEENYEAATKKKASYKSFFNSGVAEEAQIITGQQTTAGQAMQQQAPQDDPKEAEAISSYASAIQFASDDIEKSKAQYNTANAIVKNTQSLSVEKLEKAIEQYKDAIISDPQNDRARHNLAIAQLQLDQLKEQQQQQQQQNQDQQEQNQDQQEQGQEQQDQQEQNQEQNQEQQEQNQQEEQTEKEQEEKEKEEQQKKEKATRAEMEKILEMVDKQDQDVQKKVKMQPQGQSRQKKKKW